MKLQRSCSFLFVFFGELYQQYCVVLGQNNTLFIRRRGDDESHHLLKFERRKGYSSSPSGRLFRTTATRRRSKEEATIDDDKSKQLKDNNEKYIERRFLLHHRRSSSNGESYDFDIDYLSMPYSSSADDEEEELSSHVVTVPNDNDETQRYSDAPATTTTALITGTPTAAIATYIPTTATNTNIPSKMPTIVTTVPSKKPTTTSSFIPSAVPSGTNHPSTLPTDTPFTTPTSIPSEYLLPTTSPSTVPSVPPSISSSTVPSTLPTPRWIMIGNPLEGTQGNELGYHVDLSHDGSVLAVSGRCCGSPKRIYDYDAISDQYVEQDPIETYIMQEGILALSNDGKTIVIGRGETLEYVRVYTTTTYIDSSNNTISLWVQKGNSIQRDGGFSWLSEFGDNVAINHDGNIIVIGDWAINRNTGLVQVYKYNAVLDQWDKLGDPINGSTIGDSFGDTISISSNNDSSIVIVGACGRQVGEGPGYCRVFQLVRNNNNNNDNAPPYWEQLGSTLQGKVIGDLFGSSLALVLESTASSNNNSADSNGNSTKIIIAVGASWSRNFRGNHRSGRVYVYSYSSSSSNNNGNNNWVQLGSTLDGRNSQDYFGKSVDMSSLVPIVVGGASDDGERQRSLRLRLIVGAPTSSSVGYVHVYEYNIASREQEEGSDAEEEEDWQTIGQTSLTNEILRSRYGASVSITNDGSMIAVGAYQFRNPPSSRTPSGQVYIYRLLQ